MFTSAVDILVQSLLQLERDIHPVVIISAYNKALKEALDIVQQISIPIDVNDDDQILSLIKTSMGTNTPFQPQTLREVPIWGIRIDGLFLCSSRRRATPCL